MVRFDPNGSLDTAFGNNGVVFAFSGDVAIQADGKIVTVGSFNDDFGVARYNPNGSLDTTFDDDGLVTTDFGAYEAAYAVAIQADGKIVAAGYSSDTVDHNGALARYQSSPQEQVSISGRVTVNGRGLGNAVVSMTDSLGVRRIATTSTFGYYTFNNIPGDTYNISIRSKRHQFPTQTIFAGEDLSGIDFISLN